MQRFFSGARKVKQILEITKNAQKRLLQLQDEGKGKLRISLKNKGCSGISDGFMLRFRCPSHIGLSYALEYVDKPSKFDEVVKTENVEVYLESKSIMHLIGSVVDYEESILSSQFTFKNPNVTQECGCGQSFGTAAL